MGEVKDLNPEGMSQSELKKMFADYMEDYNLGIFPSEKFYSIRNFEVEEQQKAAKLARDQALADQKASTAKTTKRLAAQWAAAAEEEITGNLMDDEELRRREERQARLDRQNVDTNREREAARLEHLARESEAMISTITGAAASKFK
eukprot:NODE_4237_length_597_cov_185.605839_g3060_i0.p2 GENE.NODE_4237_length_597_cov_185.605839_g3060_i0~~NODE_4237_length_597_cov_185.605839_g3060_i0.p2  ORF type:complete len:154 (+),score=76.11 NODE_4237_length_597_cov_185.605839_g3060_i0:24-464(+)